MNAQMNEAPLAATSEAFQEKQQERSDFLASGVSGQGRGARFAILEYSAPIGKAFFVYDGELQKRTNSNGTDAVARIVECHSIQGLEDAFKRATPRDVFVGGVPYADGLLITTKDARAAGNIARSKDDLPFLCGPGVMFLDNDHPTREGDDQFEAYACAVPALARASYVFAPSSSAWLHDPETGELLKGAGGQHYGIPVQDATDIPRAMKALHDRLVLAGMGAAIVTQAGTILIRSPVDLAMRSPNQPLFQRADCGAGVVQKKVEHIGSHAGEVFLFDTRLIADLSPSEIDELVAIEDKLRESVDIKAHDVRTSWVEARVPAVAAQQGVSDEQARRFLHVIALASTKEHIDIWPGLAVEFADGTTADVGELVENPSKYEGKACRDPVEPEYRGGALVGKFYAESLTIRSFAHGGRTFHLQLAPIDISGILNQAARAVEARFTDRQTAESPVTATAGGSEPMSVVWAPPWPQTPPACGANRYHPKSDEEWAKEQESQNQAQEMPEVLLNPPGILGEITSWVLDGAIKPSFPLSLVAAMSMVATALAQKVKSETGLRTNLYLVVSAGTGNGKDHGRKCFKELFRAADLDDMLAGEDLASGPGLLNAVHRNSKSAFLMDEFGLYMQEASKQKNSPKASVIPILMKLSTSAGQVMKGTEYADERIRPRKDVQYPCPNLLATTTPESIYEALTTADVESGFLNRMLVIDVPAKRFPMMLKESAPPPEGVVAWIKAAQACSDGLRGVMPDNPFLIATTPEARTVFEELYELAQDHEHGSKLTGRLWARAFEQAVKIGLVVACASEPNAIEFSQRLKDGSIKIDQQAAVWACAFVKHAITSLQREAESRMASTEIARIALAVEGVLKKAGPRGKTRSELGRACAKFKDQPPRVQQEVIDMLKVREDVVEHTFPPGSGRGKGREAFIHSQHVDPAV